MKSDNMMNSFNWRAPLQATRGNIDMGIKESGDIIFS